MPAAISSPRPAEPVPPPKALTCAAILALVIGLPCAFLGYMAGDAVIHLIFAENSLRGDWLAFNPGEQSGGETSFGYMLIVMGLWQVFSPEWTPYAMIGLCYLAWLAMLACGWKLLHDWYPRTFWPWLWLLITGTMPGSAFNSVLGMENVLLAPVTMGLLWGAYRTNAIAEPLPRLTELTLAGGLGVLTWLRPESLFMAAGLLMWRCLIMAKRTGWLPSLLRSCCLGAIVVALFAAMFIVSVWLSGLMPFSGGVARLNMSASDGIVIGGVMPLHAKIALRFCAYFPLAMIFVLGVYRWASSGTATPVHRGVVGQAIVLVLLFSVLYSTVLPTAHLARYTIFFWPLVTLVGVYGLAESWSAWQSQLSSLGARTLLATLLAALTVIYGYEFAIRYSMLRGQHRLADVRSAHENRRPATDSLLRELRCTGPFPVSVGFIEVQMRYFFDDRVIVRTMDGIVDNRFNHFVTRTGNGVVYDYTGYFRDKRLDYIAEYLDLNPTVDDWSPVALEAMPEGSVATRDGVCFERLPGRITRLTYPGGQIPPY